MRSLKDTIVNEKFNAGFGKDVIERFFESCENNEDCKAALKSLVFSLQNAAEYYLKINKKEDKNSPEYKSSYNLHQAIGAITMEIDDVIKNDKYWRE